MRNVRATLLVAGVTAAMIAVLAIPAFGQSDADGGSMTEAEAATQGGQLDWSLLKKPKGLGKKVAIHSIGATPDGRVVAGGLAKGKPSVWTSDDGVKWATAKLPGGKGAAVSDIVAWQDGLVAIGRVVTDGKFSGFVWTSPDGTEWDKPVQLDDAIFGDLDVTPDGLAITGSLLAGTDGPVPTAWSSSDGATWQATPLGDAGQLGGSMGVSPDGVRVVQGWYPGPDGFMPVMWRSEDGATWAPVDLPPEASDGSWAGITDFGCESTGFLLGVNGPDGTGAEDGAVWYSSDGLVWQNVVESEAAITAVMADPQGCTAITRPSVVTKGKKKPRQAFGPAEPRVFTSVDGMSWTVADAPAFDSAGVLLVAPASDGQLFALGSLQPYPDGFETPRFWRGQAANGAAASE